MAMNRIEGLVVAGIRAVALVLALTIAAPRPAVIPPVPLAMPPAPAKPDLAAQVSLEARANFEEHRHRIVSECWPAAGLPRGAKVAKVTMNVTFDANGREIARGISEDRRAPAGQFARCMRTLPTSRLSVSPPGQTVAVSIPLAYP